MQSILIRSLLSGDLFAVDYVDTVPSVASIRAQLEAHYIAGKRNHVLKLFRMPSASASASAGDSKEDPDSISMHPLSDEDTVTPEDELVMICEVERRMTDLETEKVEKCLRAYFTFKRSAVPRNYELQSPVDDVYSFDGFRDAVVEAGAVVAGGSITAVFGGFAINDVDIYVNYSKARAFLAAMHQLQFRCRHTDSIQLSSEYDQSFFRKNQILVRFALECTSRGGPYKKMDVMVIPDVVNVEDVVTNFDLSFCEVWWDGRAVFASDPHGVRHKEGVLKPDYRRSLFTEFNHFIIKRLQKYTRRGYTIDTCARDYFLDTMGTSALASSAPSSIFPGKRRTENGIRPIHNTESWAVKKFIVFLYGEISQLVNSTGIIQRMNQQEREESPLTNRNREHDLYFKTTVGSAGHTRAALDSHLQTDFVDLFAALTFAVQFHSHIPENYHKYFTDVFPRTRELSPCRVLRFTLFELSEHVVRICGDSFRSEWKDRAITSFNRLMAAIYISRCHPDEPGHQHYIVENVPELVEPFFGGCSCDHCVFMHTQLAADGFPDSERVPRGMCQNCGMIHANPNQHHDDLFEEDDAPFEEDDAPFEEDD